MTCIVGIVSGNQVYIGGDSCGAAGTNITIRRDTKVFRNGDFIIGCTSSFRMIQLLRFSFKPPVIGGKDIYEYMCTDFIDAVRECFRTGGYIRKNNEVESGGNFLVGYKNRLFEVDNDFQVAENINGIHAVGCGCNIALGALYILNQLNFEPKEKVRKALQAAEFYDGAVCQPFNILSTNTISTDCGD